MDVYLTSLAIGGLGLVAMAVSGTSRHGNNHGSGSHGHSGHGHGGDGHAGHGHAGHGHASHGHAGHSHVGDSHAGHAQGSQTHSAHGQPYHGDASHGHDSDGNDTQSHGIAQTLLALMSPRTLFSVCLGLGTTGLLLKSALQGPALFAVAVAGGWAFERFIVTPIWNFTFRFASTPALTLESALMGEATAVTRFDANGQGLIAIEVDGHMVQLLGTLDSNTRANRATVLAGARLRIEDVDAARNRCTVSLL